VLKNTQNEFTKGLHFEKFGKFWCFFFLISKRFVWELKKCTYNYYFVPVWFNHYWYNFSTFIHVYDQIPSQLSLQNKIQIVEFLSTILDGLINKYDPSQHHKNSNPFDLNQFWHCASSTSAPIHSFFFNFYCFFFAHFYFPNFYFPNFCCYLF